MIYSTRKLPDMKRLNNLLATDLITFREGEKMLHLSPSHSISLLLSHCPSRSLPPHSLSLPPRLSLLLTLSASPSSPPPPPHLPPPPPPPASLPRSLSLSPSLSVSVSPSLSLSLSM